MTRCRCALPPCYLLLRVDKPAVRLEFGASDDLRRFWVANREKDFPHLELLRQQQWGLIIYDEVHMPPAPVFRATAEIQVRGRLGLTATLVREDGLEGDVFALVGPKRYDLPWKILEHSGFIAEAECHEIRLDLPDELRIRYALAEKRDKFRIAAENPPRSGLSRS